MYAGRPVNISCRVVLYPHDVLSTFGTPYAQWGGGGGATCDQTCPYHVLKSEGYGYKTGGGEQVLPPFSFLFTKKGAILKGNTQSVVVVLTRVVLAILERGHKRYASLKKKRGGGVVKGFSVSLERGGEVSGP